MDEIGDGINAKFNSWGEYTVIEDMVDAGVWTCCLRTLDADVREYLGHSLGRPW